MRRLFGTDGVRGIANEYLTPELAMEIGRALGSLISDGGNERTQVLIGEDTRISSRMLSAAVAAGLSAAGVDSSLIGVAPTPAIAYLVKKYGAKAGIVISASHNPYKYNGIKIFGEDGFKLSDELEEQIEGAVLEKDGGTRLIIGDKIGRICDTVGGIEDYIDHLISSARTRLDGMRIVLDAANGATAVSAERVFSSLGAHVIMMGDDPNGTNINEGCGSTHTEKLCQRVVAEGADVGVAFDGDGDRCLAVTGDGNMIDGDFIMAILASDMKARGRLAHNAVVGTVMTNFGFQKFCDRIGIKFISTAVGDRYVLEAMRREGYVLGGEQSGHVILREYATTGDGQLTAIALLSCVKESGKSLSELARVMKRYPQHIINLEADEKRKLSLFIDGEIKAAIRDAEAELAGGGRILVRPSGTEPLVRIMAEGDDEEKTVRVVNKLSDKISRRLTELL